jgi:Fe-Mn family superoxide dismutase
MAVLAASLPLIADAQSDTIQSRAEQARQEYRAKDYKYLLGMKGFGHDLLNDHFKLYEGYVKQVNLLTEKLKALSESGQNRSAEYAAIKYRFGWELDGMRLHELYFGNLGGNGQFSDDSELYRMIVAQYGSYENWKKDFVATGLMRGIGWAILYQDPTNGRLMNLWINEHDVGHLAGGKILLVMDVFEHAYMPQYRLDREQYVVAFFNNIDWKVVKDRFTP